MLNCETLVYERKPSDFSPRLEVAAIYVNVNGQILFLERSFGKSEGGTWGVPAGKLELDETPIVGAERELFEETGIVIGREHALQSVGHLYMRKPNLDYIYHLFSLHLSALPVILLSTEHRAYRWMAKDEVDNIALMTGAKEALDFYYQITSRKKRLGTNINAYLVLRKEGEVLLHLRKNTSYCDNQYGLLSGHVEDGESATAAIMREAYEEAGIQLDLSSLTAVHVMHRKTNRLNIDLFFECKQWQGDIVNREPDKCAALEYFPLNKLPVNTIDYIVDALKAIHEGCYYSESGWDS